MPKARASSSLRRILRFTEKYTSKVVPLRYKLYLPRMEQLLNTELINLDALEVQIYAKLDELGVDSAQQPYYMAFSKRCFETFLTFSESTAENDVSLLRQEFILRGLDSAVLDQLIPICRALAQTIKGS